MSNKPVKIAAGMAGILALGTAGYFANEWRVCNGLEQDFIDTAATIRRSSEARMLAGTLGVEVDQKATAAADDGLRMVFGKQLEHIYERCGIAAGDAAKQNGEIALFDL